MSIATEKHYTVQEVAELWGTSESTVRKLFRDEPGVIPICMPRLLPRERKDAVHRSLRIPLSVIERVHARMSGGFTLGPKVQRGRSAV